MTSAGMMNKAHVEDDDWEQADVENMSKKLSQMHVRLQPRPTAQQQQPPPPPIDPWCPPPPVDPTPYHTNGYGYPPQTATQSSSSSASPLSRVTTNAVSLASPLDPVLVAALENPRERLTLLQFEDQIVHFIRSSRDTELVFPPLSSYHRLIIHRLAERCVLEHQTSDFAAYNSMGYDTNTTRAVTLFKTAYTCVPSVLLINLSTESSNPAASSAFSSHAAPPKIMTRKPNKNAAHKNQKAPASDTKNRTIQEREKEYAAARARIFGEDAPAEATTKPTPATHVAETAKRILPSAAPPVVDPIKISKHETKKSQDWKESKAQYRDRQKEMNDPDFTRHHHPMATGGRGAIYNGSSGYATPGRYPEYARSHSPSYQDYNQYNSRQQTPPPPPPDFYQRGMPAPAMFQPRGAPPRYTTKPPPSYSDADFPPLGQ
ncbi:Aste57867_9610 [Aphanomyces stellatus]|uniref:Aste57867_9610 protein n=1 Tax=Aphanomyces stellatus TaxID=120398 RepID=A0A485KN85_9STRA|nr:hypothetical protein As57867_009572 [Aphanomyces stellatus]VFT86489.1 Aste57867_9610 [Aphanomyces stellatus]